jgi:hypothetical protein
MHAIVVEITEKSHITFQFLQWEHLENPRNEIIVAV